VDRAAAEAGRAGTRGSGARCKGAAGSLVQAWSARPRTATAAPVLLRLHTKQESLAQLVFAEWRAAEAAGERAGPFGSSGGGAAAATAAATSASAASATAMSAPLPTLGSGTAAPFDGPNARRMSVVREGEQGEEAHSGPVPSVRQPSGTAPPPPWLRAGTRMPSKKHAAEGSVGGGGTADSDGAVGPASVGSVFASEDAQGGSGAAAAGNGGEAPGRADTGSSLELWPQVVGGWLGCLGVLGHGVPAGTTAPHGSRGSPLTCDHAPACVRSQVCARGRAGAQDLAQAAEPPRGHRGVASRGRRQWLGRAGGQWSAERQRPRRRWARGRGRGGAGHAASSVGPPAVCRGRGTGPCSGGDGRSGGSRRGGRRGRARGASAVGGACWAGRAWGAQTEGDGRVSYRPSVPGLVCARRRPRYEAR
jgi:hypothetical protein